MWTSSCFHLNDKSKPELLGTTKHDKDQTHTISIYLDHETNVAFCGTVKQLEEIAKAVQDGLDKIRGAKPETCQIGLVGPNVCRRKAVTTRITSGGNKVPLCRFCDERHGFKIGQLLP